MTEECGWKQRFREASYSCLDDAYGGKGKDIVYDMEEALLYVVALEAQAVLEAAVVEGIRIAFLAEAATRHELVLPTAEYRRYVDAGRAVPHDIAMAFYEASADARFARGILGQRLAALSAREAQS